MFLLLICLLFHLVLLELLDRLSILEHLEYLKILQRYYKKCTYASKVRNICKKMIDFIYLIRYTALAQARLKAKCWVADDKVKPFLQIFRTNRAPAKHVALWEEEERRQP